jgi:hypothetical protein
MKVLVKDPTRFTRDHCMEASVNNGDAEIE